MNKSELIQQIAVNVASSAYLSETQTWIHEPEACQSWESLSDEIIEFSEALANKILEKQDELKKPYFAPGDYILMVKDKRIGVVKQIVKDKYLVQWQHPDLNESQLVFEHEITEI